jgi:hypothetical protein
VGKNNTEIDKWVLIASILLVVCVPFIFEGKKISNTTYLGFPFDWLTLYPNNGYSFQTIGFILNIIVFYFVIKILMKIYKKYLVN